MPCVLLIYAQVETSYICIAHACAHQRTLEAMVKASGTVHSLLSCQVELVSSQVGPVGQPLHNIAGQPGRVSWAGHRCAHSSTARRAWQHTGGQSVLFDELDSVWECGWGTQSTAVLPR
jgi:hypothetical protein